MTTADLTKAELSREEIIKLANDAGLNFGNKYEDREQMQCLCYEFAKAMQSAYQSGRQSGMEEAAILCDAQAKEPECPERAEYCATAIRQMKGEGR